MPHAIEVQDLTKYYNNPSAGSGQSLLAVDHVSFEAKADEVFGLLGPNGRLLAGAAL